MTDEKKPRASSEPAADAFELDDDQLTPVSTIVERLEREIGDELSARDKRIITALCRHDANQEMRHRRRSDSQETATLCRRIDDVESQIVELVGRSGNNGRVGTLKERVDKAEARRWWAVTFLAGLLVTVIGSAIAFGSWMGSIESDVKTLKERAARRNFMQPDYPAPKETAP